MSKTVGRRNVKTTGWLRRPTVERIAAGKKAGSNLWAYPDGIGGAPGVQQPA